VFVVGYSKAALKAQEAEQSRGEEVSWRQSDQLVGRTRGDHIVVFKGTGDCIGKFARIKIGAATGLTLHGDVQSLTQPPATIPIDRSPRPAVDSPRVLKSDFSLTVL